MTAAAQYQGDSGVAEVREVTVRVDDRSLDTRQVRAVVVSTDHVGEVANANDRGPVPRGRQRHAGHVGEGRAKLTRTARQGRATIVRDRSARGGWAIRQTS